MKVNALASWLAKMPGDAVAIEDNAGRVAFVNDVLCRILGYEPGELVGQPWTRLLPAQASQADSPLARSETLLQRKDGSTAPVLVTAWRLPIGDDPGQRRLSVFSHPKEPAQIQSRPGQEEILDHHLASVAHELNNSLTVVTFQSQLLTRLDPASPRFGEHLSILQDQVAQMRRIVADLRMPSYLNGPQLEAIDVNALVRRILEIEECQLQVTGVQVITDLAPDLPRVQADPRRLGQVFVNLMNNACQAMADSDPPRVLRVSTRLVLGQNGRPRAIRAYLANNGPAISRNLLRRIFEPFFTTKEPGQGAGLGLTICARIVREHGGRIWAESEDLNGATFVVELPLDASAEAGSPPSSAGLALFRRP